MKKINIILFGLILGLLVGCDKIDPPYKTQSGGGGGTGEVVQKVLLEDYTGHKCVNCPAAAELAGSLKEVYGDQLIIMAVHAGYFAPPENPPFDLDLRTEIGNKWNTDFEVVGYPSGLINRSSEQGTLVAGAGEWGERIQYIIENQEPKAVLTLAINYNQSGRNLDIDVTSQFLQDFTDQYYLQVVLLEDSIPGAQRNNDASVGDVPTIEDYMHRHVLRQDVNGLTGEIVTENQIVANEVYTHEYSLTLNSEYKEQHCAVVAFLYRTSDNQILQVEEKHIME